MSSTLSPVTGSAVGRGALGASGDDHWRLLSQIAELRTPWLSVFGERLRDESGHELEYWRIERPDSLIVVTVHRGRLILPAPSYRPGVARVTLDLAGGRLRHASTIPETAREIVRREFDLPGEEGAAVQSVLNPDGWDVDSSVSTQRLFGVSLELADGVDLPASRVGASYPATPKGGMEALRSLACVQCRAVLSEWVAQIG